MYTAKQLMPNTGTPDDYSAYWVLDGNDEIWRRAKWSCSWWRDKDLVLTNVLCYIPIPGAPDEVKPVAYPENKPSEEGKYICHITEWAIHGEILPDEWVVVGWEGDDWACVRKRVDYFIPIPLDKESLSEYAMNKCNECFEGMDKDALMKDFLATRGRVFDKYYGNESEEDMSGEERVRGITVTDMIAYLEKRGYVITKPQPEIAPCPFCGGECGMYGDDWRQIQCDDGHCDYRSGKLYVSGLLVDNVEKEVIRLHNQIAGRE